MPGLFSNPFCGVCSVQFCINYCSVVVNVERLQCKLTKFAWFDVEDGQFSVGFHAVDGSDKTSVAIDNSSISKLFDVSPAEFQAVRVHGSPQA